jgi:N-methylhydantoinase A/oxoprolinase/acetone carboxylase beta subunit
VPTEAVQFAHELRVKYDGRLTDTLVDRLIFEINKQFLKREETRVSRVKADCAREIKALRAKLIALGNYDVIMQKTELERVK